MKVKLGDIAKDEFGNLGLIIDEGTKEVDEYDDEGNFLRKVISCYGIFIEETATNKVGDAWSSPTPKVIGNIKDSIDVFFCGMHQFEKNTRTLNLWEKGSISTKTCMEEMRYDYELESERIKAEQDYKKSLENTCTLIQSVYKDSKSVTIPYESMIEMGALSSFQFIDPQPVTKDTDTLGLSLNTISEIISLWSEHQGFDNPPSIETREQKMLMNEKLMLVVTEVAEACEEVRKDNMENFKEEIADVIIRLLNICGSAKIDIDKTISQKMEKNRKRPKRHGKAC